ncbi:UNVERIFIED_CONTAM: FACT complex subunit SPT16, partial [Sesamum calycinum]
MFSIVGKCPEPTKMVIVTCVGYVQHWSQHKDEYWGSSDVLAVATPPPSEDLRYLKSSALNIWLLGYEFPETIMVFGDKHIHFLCSQKKASLLEVVKKSAKETVGVDVVMHVKAKNDNGSNQMESILRAIRSQSKSDHAAPTVGYIAREAPEGKLLEIWTDKLKGSGLTLSDISNEGNSGPCQIGVKLRAENVDICYPPIFQSGVEIFDLRPSASSNDDYLYYDSSSVIICAIGSRYNSYCSNVARTYLIDSNAVQSKAYERGKLLSWSKSDNLLDGH